MTKNKLGCFTLIGVVVLFLVSIVLGPVGQAIIKKPLPEWLTVPKPHVLLPAEVIFPLGHFMGQEYGITNSLIASWVSMVVLLLIAVLVMRRSKLIPSRFQGLMESAFEWLYNFCKEVAGEKNGRRLFPIITTIIVFVLFNGWLSLLPGFGTVLANKHALNVEAAAAIQEVNEEYETKYDFKLKLPTETGTIGGLVESLAEEKNLELEVGTKLHEGVVKIVVEEMRGGHVEKVQIVPQEPLFRGANTDINTPLALAVISFVFVIFTGVRSLGIGFLRPYTNVGRFFRGWGKLFTGKVKSGLADLFFGAIDGVVSFIEILSLFFRLISLTFRLFGNMIGGEILVFMLLFLAFITPVIIPYGLEILFSLIQALIFGFLTLVFAVIASTPHEGEGHSH